MKKTGEMKEKTMNLPEHKNFRRHLRTNGTPAEGFLWTMIKSGQIDGLRFRRQYSIGHYILDFYCPSLKLCIELDGDVHFHEVSYNHDLERAAYLWKCHGIRILRYENKIVFDYPQAIIEDIRMCRDGEFPQSYYEYN